MLDDVIVCVADVPATENVPGSVVLAQVNLALLVTVPATVFAPIAVPVIANSKEFAVKLVALTVAVTL